MERIKLFLLISIVAVLTHLINREMNTDMSFGFAVGMIWSIFIKFIAKIFAQ